MEPDSSSDQRPVIQASEILAKIERGEDVEYDGVIVEGDLDISGLDLPTEHVKRTEHEYRTLGVTNELKVISSQIMITNSKIRGKVIFSNARFLGIISFTVAKFGDVASFLGAEFRGKANFWSAQFGSDARFDETRFSGNASFVGAKFGGFASFEKAEFGGKADFWGAQFSDFVTFRHAQLSNGADFPNAKFSNFADFRHAQFNDYATFPYAQFNDYADFRDSEFNNRLILKDLKFVRLYITWNSIRDNLVYDGPTYLALIKNFKVIEQFSDADDCYYQYRKESQAQKKWYSKENRLIEFLVRSYNWTSTKIRRIFKYLSWIKDYSPFTWIHRFNWSKLLDWIGFVSCGYGVRIQPIILWVLSSVLSFTLLYKLLPPSCGGIAESGPSTVTMEAMNNSTLLFTFGAGDGVISPSWGDCLYFSFTALTGGTPDGLHPVGLVKYAVMVESVLGYLFLALFVVVLARKIIR